MRICSFSWITYLINHLNLLVLILCLVSQTFSQGLTYKTQSLIEICNQIQNLDRFELIVPNKYVMRNAALNGYSTAHTLNQNKNLRVIFGITALDFHQSSASLSFRFINIGTKRNNPNPPKFLDFDLTILNETVIFRLRVDVAIIQQQDIDEIYITRNTLTCQVMNQGIGYRSQNFTFPVTVKPQFDPEVRQVYAALYYRGFNLFNPNGSYFYLNWEFYYNHTHYTLVFHTQDENLVSFIEFSVILVDLNNAYQKIGYRRAFAIDMLNCSFGLTQTCPGKAQWTADPLYEAGFKSYLFGLTKLNFTKHQPTNWYFDTTDITNLVQNYVETNSLIWGNMTVFIIAQVDCQPSSRYFDPYTKTCETNCPGTGSPYSIQQTGGGGEKFCRKCYYACTPGQCANEQDDKCQDCSVSMFREPDSGGGTFKCNCMTGYVDVGLQYCPPCSYYIPGCLQCSSTTVCTLCSPNMYITSSKSCMCTLTQTTTRYGTCLGIVGCLVYFSDSLRSNVCIQCNMTQKFVLSNHTCDCISGYQLQSTGGKWVCVPLTVCGDGYRTISEQCDDFNNFNGDGCNGTCSIEIGYVCFANLRQTSICIQNVTSLKYVGAMKLQGQPTADLYFQLWPYNYRMQDVGILSKYLQASMSNFSSMRNLQIVTTPHFEDDKLRIRLRYDYTQDIDPSIEHNLTLNVFDRQKQYFLQTKFSIVGTNLKLTMIESQGNLIALKYVIIAIVILAFFALFLSIFTQNWIGIELIHTYQFCFFYYILLQNIDEKQFEFLKFLSFCNGYNNFTDFVTYYEYIDFNRKIYLMDFRKQFFINFNFTALVFGLPLLLVLWKLLRKLASYCQRSKKLKTYSTPNNKISQPSCLDKLLSSKFIIGKVFITLNLAFMNVILFCFFINQTSFLQQNESFNGIFQQFYLFAMITSVITAVGLLTAAAIHPFRYSEVSIYQLQEPVEFVKFKRFSPSYPIIYTSVIALKIILLALFQSYSNSAYLFLAIQAAYFIGFTIFRPYKRLRSQQTNYCYFLHNLHNLWNTGGLIALIIVLIIANMNMNYTSNLINVFIKCIILAIEIISLVMAYMRLFMSRRLTGCINQAPKQQKEILKNPFAGYPLQDTDRKLNRKQPNIRKDSFGQKSQSKMSKLGQISTIYNRPRRTTTKSSFSYSPSRIREFT